MGERGEGGEHPDGGPGVARGVEIRWRGGEPVREEGGLGVCDAGHGDQGRHREVSEGGGEVGRAGAGAWGDGDGGREAGRR